MLLCKFIQTIPLTLTTALMLGTTLFAGPAAASPSVETFVLSAGGRSAGTLDPPCTGGGAPAPVYDFFGVWGVGIPTAGLGPCGVAGGFDYVTSPTGPLADDRSVASSWPAVPANSFVGAAAATANFGSLSARSHGEFNGEFSNLNVTGSDGFGIADEGFTITSPSFPAGQPGTVTFRVTVTGAFSTTAYSEVGVQLYNRVNGGQSYALFNSYGFYATELPILQSWGGDGLAGFTLSPGAMSGSGEISSAPIPIVFGASFDYKLGLLVEAVSYFSSIVDSDFDAAITGIQVNGPGGEVVSDFAVVSASGTPYGPGGVTSGVEFALDGVNGLAHFAAFPNPATDEVELRFNLPRSIAARLEIYDSTGRRIRRLDDASGREGDQSVSWNGRDDHGLLTPAGVYFARLSTQKGAATTRLTLLR